LSIGHHLRRSVTPRTVITSSKYYPTAISRKALLARCVFDFAKRVRVRILAGDVKPNIGRHPIGRHGPIDEVVAFACTLCADENRFLAGALAHVRLAGRPV
jgi:hypothetical protein